MSKENERWNIDGDCSKCRKCEYCGKQCKVSKIETENFIRNMFLEKTGLNKLMGAINNGLNKYI